MDTEERWVSVDEVSAHLDVTKDTIYRWIDKKGFPVRPSDGTPDEAILSLEEATTIFGQTPETKTGFSPEGVTAAGGLRNYDRCWRYTPRMFDSQRRGRGKKVEIPKDGGKVRVLGVPAIRDRAVQGALKLIVEPIFEADFHDGSYGYRPKRAAHEAVARVAKAIVQNKTRVIDVDLAALLDAAPYCPPFHGM